MLQEIRAKRDEITALGAEYGYFNFRIFGSMARGEADDQSDIDLLVDYHTPRDPDKLGLAGMDLDEKLSKLLGRKVDLVVAQNLKPHYARFILPEARIL